MANLDDRSEIERLRAQLATQEAEIARLRQAAEGRTTTRRDVLRGAGLVAGGIAAAAAIAGTAGSKPAVAVEGHNIRLQGNPCYLFLKLNGSQVNGDSSPITSLGRQDAIFGLYFQSKLFRVLSSTGVPSSQRRYEPLVMRKYVDKSTPLLIKALVQGEVAEALFKFYRPDPSGDGTEQFYYSVEIKQARIVSVNQYAPQVNDLSGGGATLDMEEIQFTFNQIEWTYQNGGITFTDTFNSQA